jgi:hypothetical protein
VKRLIAVAGSFLLAIALTGCPAGTQQDAAKASLQVTVVMTAAQQVEITAHNQQLIPDSEHAFIQKQFKSLAEVDKTANTCISAAATKGAVVICINAAVDQVEQINQQGGLYLKSPTAQSDFSMAIASIKGILQTISVTLGGAQ